MAIQLISNLEPEDVLKLLQFSRTLTTSFSHFETAALDGLKSIFGYSITTYTIFDEDDTGSRYVKSLHSNYFPERIVQIYKQHLFQEDPGFKDREVVRARSSASFTVKEYDVNTQNIFEQFILKYGLQYQVLIGANVSADCPLHCLCIYKPRGAEPLSDYELTLIDAIGRIFSEAVGTYKKYMRLQSCNTMYRRYVDTEKLGGAIYIPKSGTLHCTQMFAEYVSYLTGDDQTQPEHFVKDLFQQMSSPKGNFSQNSDMSTVEIKDCLITVKKCKDTIEEGTAYPFYCISISHKCQNKIVPAPKVSTKKLYLTHQLTAREAEIAALLEAGLSNQEISDTLVISMATVKTHVQNIYSKFDVRSRKEFLLAVQE